MRKCIRCGADMVEDCYHEILTTNGAKGEVVLKKSEGKLFNTRLGEASIAVCPSCGEISWYLSNTRQLK